MSDLHSGSFNSSIKKTLNILFSVVVLIISGVLLYGGVKLVSLGGSYYYLIAGLAYLLLAIFSLLRKPLLQLTLFWFLLSPVFGHYLKQEQ